MKAVLLLLVALVVANAAPLLHADGPNVVPGSYIVMLKDTLTREDRDVHILNLKDSILTTHADAAVGFVYESFMGFSARLTEDLLKAELAHPDVKYVEADQVVSINTDQVAAPNAVVTQTGATWGISRIWDRPYQSPLRTTYQYNSIAGSNVDVYVIDTGVLITHNEFAIATGSRATFVYSSVTNEANNDLNGHGTHCAGTIGGTIFGVAKNVSIKAVKVLNSAGSGTTAGVAAGVDYVTVNYDKTRPAIGSMSLGGGANQVMDDAVARSIGAGVHYAIAAGNSNANTCNYSPARVATAVTVGATESLNDNRASYSNFGTCNTVFAPGTSITSAWIGSNTATNTISGTSMATPHVAGALAVYLSAGFPLLPTPASAKDWLISTSTPNIVTNPGTGSPNRFLFSPSS